MSVYLILILLGCWTLGIAPNVLSDMHSLQLNSYRTERYRRWQGQAPLRSFHISAFIACVPLLLGVFSLPLAGLIWGGFFILLFVTRNQSPQKKPLVLTRRVWRLLAMQGLLVGIMGVTIWALFAAGWREGVLLAALSVVGGLSPLLLCLSNTLMQPIEQRISAYYYHDAQRLLMSHRDLTLIGITGSYGKTSTKFMLQQCLSAQFTSLMTPDSFNTTLGVVRVIRERLRPIHEMFVVEMGARQQGDIKEICTLVKPSIGIITAIGEQHLETFHDVAAITRTKLELFASLDNDALAVYNADDSVLCHAVKPTAPRYVTYGIDNPTAHYRCVALQHSTKGTQFRVVTPKGGVAEFHTRLLGRHNVYNLLAAISVSVELGISLEKLIAPIASLQPVAHRLELRKNQAGVTILDNAFSSNPQGAKYSLEVLASLEGQRKIMITPGMVELGSREQELNKLFGEQAAKVCDYVILVGAKRAEPIQAGLLAAGYNPDNLYIAGDLQDGQSHLNALARAGDVVLYENDLPDTYNEVNL